MSIVKNAWRRCVWPLRNAWTHRVRSLQRTLGVRYRAESPRPVTVILLSYARPANIDRILSTLVLCEFVGEIVISNNNPDIPLERFVRVADPRIRLVRQPVRTPASVRFDLSLEARHDDVVAIDDDIFPSPGQLRRLVGILQSDPSSPHGFGGETWGRPPSHAAYRFVSRPPTSMPVDALVWIFAYTKGHVRRYFELLHELGIENGDLRSSEDVVLSCAGVSPARIHPVGELRFCPSDCDEGIATFKRPGFADHRRDLVARCLRLRGEG